MKTTSTAIALVCLALAGCTSSPATQRYVWDNTAGKVNDTGVVWLLDTQTGRVIAFGPNNQYILLDFEDTWAKNRK